MEQSKYYTPGIEEFHVGFEYEWRDLTDTTHEWEKSIQDNVDPGSFSHGSGYCPFEYQLSESGIRVKYIDKEDIEDLGLIYDDLSNTFEVQVMGRTDTSFFEYWLIIENFIENKGYRISINGEDNENCFDGIIKNKSELKKLMQQLGLL